MIGPSLLILCSGLGLGAEKLIDGFPYADGPSAQAVWRASVGTPPVRMVPSESRRVLQISAPFATQPDLKRTVLDRSVDLNLAGAGQFLLEIAVDDPTAVGQLSLYFRSGDGWYAANAAITSVGWQTLRFSKASFRPEGQPVGWHQVDGVRISIWRGPSQDFTARLKRLAAVSHDIALVVPAANAEPGDGEAGTALRAAEDLGGMLEDLGLGADAVEDAALASGALGDRHVAILAYNPHLPDAAAQSLREFVERGGKLFVCYTLHPRLAEVLGIRRTRYFRPERSGNLAEIRFSSAEIPGMPDSVRQASWNISIPEPADSAVSVLGSWVDDQGHATGHAALVAGERGAFFGHLVLTDDRPGKLQMLAAVLGRLHPPLWKQMAQARIDQIGQVGHLTSIDQVAGYVRTSGKAHAASSLVDAIAAAESAQRKFAHQAYPDVVARAARAHELLCEAYARSLPCPEGEVRAIWNHSGTGAYPGDWKRTAAELSTAGFNRVLPNMLWAGRAHYASDVLPRSATFDEFGDQIADCVAACRPHGIEVHVWKVNHNLSGAPRAFVARMRAEQRLQVSHNGQERTWLCPSDPRNLELEVESMLEVVRKYDVDGLHFDYIRYPDRNHCYCAGCRERFQAATGSQVARWPRDCVSGKLQDAYQEFRREQITRLVATVSRKARQIKPGIRISAAVFGSYPDCRDSVGQDWLAWVQAGYLDFVCPMDYSQSDPSFRGLVQNQMRLVDGRIPVYPGIGAWRLPPDRVLGQIHYARDLGAPGFTVFDLNSDAANSLLPVLAAGAGRADATPPTPASIE